MGAGALQLSRNHEGKWTMSVSKALRNLLQNGPVIAASVYDGLSARIAELAGFEALHLTGFGMEATQLGAPDMGLLTMTEVVAHTARAVEAAPGVPIIADIDTGFGGANNVARTIREMERAGVAGVHIEDQPFPKRCPVLGGRRVVPREVAVDRIKGALDARRDSNFIIVARTDADAVSFNESVERANLYLEAGADMVMPIVSMVDGTRFSTFSSDEQMAFFRRLTSAIRGPVMTSGVRPPSGYTMSDIAEAGFAFVMSASSGVAAAANALADVYESMRRHGTDEKYFNSQPGRYLDSVRLMQDLRLSDYNDVDARFGGGV
jgi:2-methylisocitrate lyase-like PEP mutase family enzyme